MTKYLGCRAGDACPFIHDPSRLKTAVTGSGPREHAQHVSKDVTSEQLLSGPRAAVHGPSAMVPEGRRFVAPPVESARVVQKPVPRAQAENPREYQIQQLRRRFSPAERDEDNGIAFTFRMVPSDPDFPFEMAGLECILHVPLTYPEGGRPSLEVKNKDMDRGYQINVERGFWQLAEKSPHATLLGLINALDRQLESLLTEQKAETVKLISNAQKNKMTQPSETVVTSGGADLTVGGQNSPPVYTYEQRKTAEARRAVETRQLETRLGRLPLFLKSSDGIAYDIPIEPRKPGDLPVPLQAVKAVRLYVPLLYPLELCRVEVLGVTREAASTTEKGFERRARSSPDISLIGHVNYLAQHMHEFATESPGKSASEGNESPQIANLAIKDTADEEQLLPKPSGDDDDRSHIKIIPRPPEWATRGEDSEDDGDDSDLSDLEEVSTDEIEDVSDPNPEPISKGPERGISLSFPFLELYSVEILELVSLCITIKCERCKDTMDVSNLQNNAKADAADVRSESCKKCANALSIGYRRELMHANSVRAGYLDLDGCTVVDLLPSHFVPTCAECSTTFPSPGVVSVRGESSMAICRECHRRMSFKLPEVKFLIVSTAAAARAGRAPPRKKPKERLGVVAGQELPRRGRCNHYSKSCRWFRFVFSRVALGVGSWLMELVYRFSCCSKVFACDR